MSKFASLLITSAAESDGAFLRQLGSSVDPKHCQDIQLKNCGPVLYNDQSSHDANKMTYQCDPGYSFNGQTRAEIYCGSAAIPGTYGYFTDVYGRTESFWGCTEPAKAKECKVVSDQNTTENWYWFMSGSMTGEAPLNTAQGVQCKEGYYPAACRSDSNNCSSSRKFNIICDDGTLKTDVNSWFENYNTTIPADSQGEHKLCVPRLYGDEPKLRQLGSSVDPKHCKHIELKNSEPVLYNDQATHDANKMAYQCDSHFTLANGAIRAEIYCGPSSIPNTFGYFTKINGKTESFWGCTTPRLYGDEQKIVIV